MLRLQGRVSQPQPQRRFVSLPSSRQASFQKINRKISSSSSFSHNCTPRTSVHKSITVSRPCVARISQPLHSFSTRRTPQLHKYIDHHKSFSVLPRTALARAMPALQKNTPTFAKIVNLPSRNITMNSQVQLRSFSFNKMPFAIQTPQRLLSLYSASPSFSSSSGGHVFHVKSRVSALRRGFMSEKTFGENDDNPIQEITLKNKGIPSDIPKDTVTNGIDYLVDKSLYDYLQGNLEGSLHKINAALDLYEKGTIDTNILKHHPSSLFTHKANLLSQKKDFDTAYELYDMGIHLGPKRVESYFNKSVTLMRNEMWKDALMTLDRAIEEVTDVNNFGWVFVAKGQCLDNLDWPEEAVKFYKKGIECEPQNPGLVTAAATGASHLLLIHMKNPRAALQILEEAAQVATDDQNLGDIFFHTANVFIDQDKYDEALEAIEKSIQHAPENSTAHANKAGILKKLERPEDGKEAAERALKIDQDDHIAWVNLGYCCEALAQWNSARKAFTNALALSPDDEVIRQKVASFTEVLDDQERMTYDSLE